MAKNQPLTTEEKLKITEVLRKGNLSHREIARQFERSQSTVSQIARDAGLRPTHRRKRTPAASDIESTYDKQGRVNFEDKFISVLDGMVTNGGLSPRDAREVAQAAKVMLDARRAEDVEPAEGEDETPSGHPHHASFNLEEVFAKLDQEIEEMKHRKGE